MESGDERWNELPPVASDRKEGKEGTNQKMVRTKMTPPNENKRYKEEPCSPQAYRSAEGMMIASSPPPALFPSYGWPPWFTLSMELLT